MTPGSWGCLCLEDASEFARAWGRAAWLLSANVMANHQPQLSRILQSFLGLQREATCQG